MAGIGFSLGNPNRKKTQAARRYKILIQARVQNDLKGKSKVINTKRDNIRQQAYKHNEVNYYENISTPNLNKM